MNKTKFSICKMNTILILILVVIIFSTYIEFTSGQRDDNINNYAISELSRYTNVINDDTEFTREEYVINISEIQSRLNFKTSDTDCELLLRLRRLNRLQRELYLENHDNFTVILLEEERDVTIKIIKSMLKWV